MAKTLLQHSICLQCFLCLENIYSILLYILYLLTYCTDSKVLRFLCSLNISKDHIVNAIILIPY